MFFYILYKTGYFLANALPLRAAYWLAERFCDIHYFVSKKDRDAVAGNLSIVLKKDAAECRALAQKVFRNFGLYFVDFLRMPRLNKDNIDQKVEIVGLENVEGVLKQKMGVIVLTCHIGNWELGGVTMGIKGYDISAVVLSHRHKNINEFFIRQREEKGLKAIKANSIMKRCVSVLLRGGILALAGDRDFTGSGLMLDFFGVPTSIPKGPAMLGLKTNSAIVPGFTIRDGRHKYKLIFEKPIYVKEMPGVTNEEIVKRSTETFVSIMEKYIMAYPEQWLVFRKFWEAPVDAFVL